MGRLSKKLDNYQWMKFYPSDWLHDGKLSRCSAESRGVWIGLICRMWSEDMRGVIDGDTETLAQLIGCKASEVERSLVELRNHGVFSLGKDVSDRLPQNAIVCRRMYSEWHTSQARSEAGRAGGEAGKDESKARYGNQNAVRNENAKTQANTQNNASKTQAKINTQHADTSTTYENDTQANIAKTQANALFEKSEAKKLDLDHQPTKENSDTSMNSLPVLHDDVPAKTESLSWSGRLVVGSENISSVGDVLQSVLHETPRSNSNQAAALAMKFVIATGGGDFANVHTRELVSTILEDEDGYSEINILLQKLNEHIGDKSEFAKSELERMAEGGMKNEAV